MVLVKVGGVGLLGLDGEVGPVGDVGLLGLEGEVGPLGIAGLLGLDGEVGPLGIARLLEELEGEDGAVVVAIMGTRWTRCE
ncbi:MAG: hypothetical protein R3C05_25495 [Pirellulaceae bacterium]